MNFKQAEERWLKSHKSRRVGRRLDGLNRGHGYGNQLFLEKVWWRLFGQFENLHPEYEVLDSRGLPFYADFMWRFRSVRFIFEIQDFGSHCLNIDRERYRKELNRGMFLQSLSFRITYISLDELKENPELIFSMIQNILSPFLNETTSKYNKLERELMRLAIQHNRIIRPIDAARNLEVHIKTATKHLKNLVQKNKFTPHSTGASGRITSYKYVGSLTDPSMY